MVLIHKAKPTQGLMHVFQYRHEGITYEFVNVFQNIFKAIIHLILLRLYYFIIYFYAYDALML